MLHNSCLFVKTCKKCLNFSVQVVNITILYFSTLSKLPEPHFELLRYFMCVLYHIDQKSDENKMTAYNLSVCIAPSLLWPKGNNDPLASPPALLQYMIENCPQVFGPDSVYLFGDIVEQKVRQDSSTDSDSMHSVLSSHGKLISYFIKC